MKIQVILHQSIYYDIIKCGVLWHYPNPEIASSWDADWNTSIKNIDCSGISTGPNMASNTGEGAGCSLWPRHGAKIQLHGRLDILIMINTGMLLLYSFPTFFFVIIVIPLIFILIDLWKHGIYHWLQICWMSLIMIIIPYPRSSCWKLGCVPCYKFCTLYFSIIQCIHDGICWSLTYMFVCISFFCCSLKRNGCFSVSQLLSRLYLVGMF